MKFSFLLSISMSVLVMSSCSTTKYDKVPYFTNLPDKSGTTVKRTAFQAPVIETDDLLYVMIQTADGATASVLSAAPAVLSVTNNAMQNAGSAQINNSMQPTITSYLVNQFGDIDLPLLGKLHVVGLTTAVATDSIRNRAKVHLNDPTVTVRFANFKVNVMGEVTKPGSYVIPNEKVSILDALAMAGDITVYGKKENVMVIRNVGDSSKVMMLNLNEKETFQNANFYLKQNDIVYVEPGKAKLANMDGTKTRNFAIAASVLSVIIVLASRIN